MDVSAVVHATVLFILTPVPANKIELSIHSITPLTYIRGLILELSQFSGWFDTYFPSTFTILAGVCSMYSYFRGPFRVIRYYDC